MDGTELRFNQMYDERPKAEQITLAQIFAYGQRLMEHGEDFASLYVRCGVEEVDEPVSGRHTDTASFRAPLRVWGKFILEIDGLCRKHFGIDANHCENPPISILLDPYSALMCMASAESRSYVDSRKDIKGYDFWKSSGKRYRLIEVSEPFATYLREAERRERKRQTRFGYEERYAFACQMCRWQNLVDEAEGTIAALAEKGATTEDPARAKAERDREKYSNALVALREAAEAVGLTDYTLVVGGKTMWRVV